MTRTNLRIRRAGNTGVLGDRTAPTFGLPRSLWIPIAASSIEAIVRFVGAVRAQRAGRDGRPRAVLVEALPGTKEREVPLWTSEIADLAMQRLHAAQQVWVDVDYGAYRQAWLAFGLPILPGQFLDHVQNRRAMRLRGRTHPWLRLSAIRRRVNTSGGSRTGGEGLEYEYLTAGLPGGQKLRGQQIIYADPMDLTKMLDIEPGSRPLEGVRETQKLFYPLEPVR